MYHNHLIQFREGYNTMEGVGLYKNMDNYYMNTSYNNTYRKKEKEMAYGNQFLYAIKNMQLRGMASCNL